MGGGVTACTYIRIKMNKRKNKRRANVTTLTSVVLPAASHHHCKLLIEFLGGGAVLITDYTLILRDETTRQS